MADRVFKFTPRPRTVERIEEATAMWRLANEYQYKDPDQYHEIIGDFYRRETIRRSHLIAAIGGDTSHILRALQFVSSREHMIDWVVDWLWTYDPRNVNLNLPTNIPWIPWKRQIECWEWLFTQYLNSRGGYIEKTRDAGASWCFCALFLREWRWIPGAGFGMGSNKMESVDKKDNPKALFVKMRYLLDHLPDWWMPQGWDPRKHDKLSNLVNPENGSNIAGEAGDEIGRGDRRGAYLVDESAYLEHPQIVEGSLSRTTDSQFHLSTPNGMNFYAQQRFSGRYPVFTFNWSEDPRKSQEWHDRTKKLLRATVFAQEVEHDYNASVEDVFIPPAHVSAAVNLKLSAMGTKGAGLDIAAGGANLSSLATREGPVVKVVAWDYANGVDLTHRAIDECNKAGVEYLNYDKIGVGYAVQSTMGRTEMEMAFQAFAVGAGEAASDAYYQEFNKRGNEIFVNARAEWWYLVARRFERTYERVMGLRAWADEDCISIEEDADLRAQLSSPKRRYTETGKMGVESKQDMISRGIKSPDKADALVMSLIPQNAGIRRVWGGIEPLVGRLNIAWREMDRDSRLMCSIWVEENLVTSIVLGLWNPRKHTLVIWDEAVVDNPRPELIIPLLAKKIREKSAGAFQNLKPFTVLGNEVMFNDLTGEMGDLRQLYGKYRVYVRRNEPYDEYGATQQVARLLFRKSIILSSDLKDLPQQIRTWHMAKNKFAKGYGLARALCNSTAFLWEAGAMRKEKEPPRAYSSERTRILEENTRMAATGAFRELAAREIQGRIGRRPQQTKSGWI